MTSIIRAQNQIVRLVQGSNGRIKRSLSLSCISSNMDDFHKHRRQQRILEQISIDAKKNFDPRTETQIKADQMKQRRAKREEGGREYNFTRTFLLPLEDFYQWLKQTWLPKSKFRYFIIGPIVFIAIYLVSLGPVYAYGQVKALLGIGTDEVYWETKSYKNPIVGNREKADRQDWVFQDTPRERFGRIFGLGSDWMTELPFEERIQFWDWPWEDWLMYDVFPMPHNQREFDIPTSYITNPQFKNAQICPDCWRVMLYSCLFLTTLFWVTTFKYFPMIGAFIAMLNLGWGNTGNDPFSYVYASLWGTPDFITGNKQVGLQNMFSSTTQKNDYLPSIETGDYTDKNWLVWKYSWQRRNLIPYFDKYINLGFWSKPVMAGQRHSCEMETEHYIYSMAEIDDHVRNNMTQELKIQMKATDWEYGRDYPMNEIINMINTRALTDRKYGKGQRDQTKVKNPTSELSPGTTEDQEIENFMKSLEAKFQEAEAKA